MIERRTCLALLGVLFAAPVVAKGEPAHPRVRRHYVQGRYGQIHLRIAEPPVNALSPPLLLLHQSPLSGRMFDQFLPVMADHRRVIAADTPGYGESDRPIARPDLAGYSDAILDAVLPLCGPRIDVLGYHTGSVIAADMAARRDEIRRAVMISFPLLEQEQRQDLIVSLDEPNSYDEDGSHLTRQWSSSFGARANGQTLEQIARLVAEKERPGLHGEWALQSAIEADLDTILASIEVPTLVAAPHDGLVGETRAAAALIANSQLIEWPDLAYGLFDVAAGRIAAAVAAFLDS